MVSLNIGCNFSEAHVDTILALNQLEDAKHCITHVYGSPGTLNPFGSVRPARREYTTTQAEFSRVVELLKDYDITTNITLNSLLPATHCHPRLNIFDSVGSVNAMQEFVEMLAPLKCNLIIAHPGLLDFLRDGWVGNDKSPPIIISTIMNVHRLSQLEYIKERWPSVIRVCPALWKNRDFTWLSKANEIIPLELIVNEFCSMGGHECEGLYRQACYLGQSLGIQNWNPLEICTEERKKHPESWLMARFILPQWLSIYKAATGVEHFKITGRTHPASFIKSVGTKYIIGKAEGNLLSLWGQLEATMEGVDQQAAQKHALSENYIPIEIAEKLTNCIATCSTGEGCGISCPRCKQLIKEYTCQMQQ